MEQTTNGVVVGWLVAGAICWCSLAACMEGSYFVYKFSFFFFFLALLGLQAATAAAAPCLACLPALDNYFFLFSSSFFSEKMLLPDGSVSLLLNQFVGNFKKGVDLY